MKLRHRARRQIRRLGHDPSACARTRLLSNDATRREATRERYLRADEVCNGFTIIEGESIRLTVHSRVIKLSRNYFRISPTRAELRETPQSPTAYLSSDCPDYDVGLRTDRRMGNHSLCTTARVRTDSISALQLSLSTARRKLRRAVKMTTMMPFFRDSKVHPSRSNARSLVIESRTTRARDGKSISCFYL